MDNTDKTEKTLSRRKALARIGLFATAAYTIPAFATLSMAQANSGASEASSSSEASDPSEPSEASAPSEASGPSISIPSEVEALCVEAGVEGGLTNADYVACLIENGEALDPAVLLQLEALTF